jgi:hypothetical protein
MPRSDFTIPRLSLPKALLISLGIVLVAALVLYAMGRAPVCPCPFKLWVGRGQPEQSQHFLDWYSYTHVLHGVVFYFLLTVILRGRLSVAARLVIATLIEGGWEIFENTPFIINLPVCVTIFLFIASEVLLFLLLRDNLLLNVIMLIYPMEWIRQLQTGG